MSKAEKRPDDQPADQPQSNGGAAAETPSPLQEQLEAALAERDANRDRWLRSQAELDNFRKRTQKETEENRRYQAATLMRDLLPALDNLQRAVDAAESSRSIEELLEGVRLVARQFEEVLARHALEPIEAVGQPFDPNRHEAVQQLPSDEYPAMTVIRELERGFQLHDRVVRPSKVIVSSGPPEASEETDNR